MPLVPLSTVELTQRAQGLHRLGNSPARIRKILAELDATPEQIEEAMAQIDAVEAKRQSNDSFYLWVLGGVTVIFLGVVFFATYWRLVPAAVQQNPLAPAPTDNPRAKATSTLSVKSMAQTLMPGVPVEMLPSLIPSNVPANFMLATPAVIRQPTSGTPTRCPRTSAQAASLFGGEAADWTFDPETQGWRMTLVGGGTSVFVPEGMRAGYLLLINGPEMRSVTGPATLKDINFIAITCE